jgi:hypothetical protein
MRLSLIIILLAHFSLVACGSNYKGEDVQPEGETFSDEPGSSEDASQDPDPTKDGDAPTVLINDKVLDDAYNSFLAQGVPKVALQRTFEFYRNNRAATGGLQKTSCLKKPMSETGEIAPNSSRYDTMTLAQMKQGIRNERYIMIVDYTQANTKARGYLLDLQPDENGKFILYTQREAHGYGSQAVNGIPTVFTNASGLGTTTSGFFLTANTNYPYIGHAGGVEYHSVGMRLYGLESTNNLAEHDSKVAHGAPYVTDTSSGNSAGCPAMKPDHAVKLLPILKGGMLWYHHTSKNNDVNYQSPSC